MFRTLTVVSVCLALIVSQGRPCSEFFKCPDNLTIMLLMLLVSAESSPSLLNRDLQARQGWTLPPDEVPAAVSILIYEKSYYALPAHSYQCQAGCTSVNTMVSTCTHVSCLCTNAVGSALQSCFTCVVNSGSQITKEAGQQQLTRKFSSF
jgi:hypothetical protein